MAIAGPAMLCVGGGAWLWTQETGEDLFAGLLVCLCGHFLAQGTQPSVDLWGCWLDSHTRTQQGAGWFTDGAFLLASENL